MFPGLDPIDRKILEILQQDASLSSAEIVSRVGLSQSPCWRRIERLQGEGYIRKRDALLDRHKLGLEMMVFAHIKLKSHAQDALPRFEAAVRDLSEVVECYTVLGDTDYILRVVTRDLTAYERFFSDKLSHIADLQFITSAIALSEVKCSTKLPLSLAV